MGRLTALNSNYGINHMDYILNTNSPGAFNGSGFIPVDQSPKLSQIDGHNIFLTNLPVSKI